MDRQAAEMPCKICGAAAKLFDVCDFATYCHRPPTGPEKLSGVPVYYHRCQTCGFLFTALTDRWSPEDFRRHIYNDDYVRYDPGYADERPQSNATMLTNLFGNHRQSISVLDFGGGNGATVDLLKANGFLDALCYDPISRPQEALPDRRFDLVTCFEVLEHANDPMEVVRRLAGLTGGMVLFSTLLQPADIETQRLRWWYAAPRNGHISLFSRKSLALAWQTVGLSLGSFSENLHVAFRQPPAFAAHLFRNQPAAR